MTITKNFQKKMRNEFDLNWEGSLTYEKVVRYLPHSKSEWMPSEGYRTFAETKKDVGHYLMDYYNCYRPHQNNGGIAPAMAEEKPNLLSGNS